MRHDIFSLSRLSLAGALAVTLTSPLHADDALLEDALSFAGEIFFLDSDITGLVIAGIRDGESAVFGFGEVAKGSGLEPNGDTAIGVGSLTKTFTGLTLAQMVADGRAQLTEPAAPHVSLAELPQGDGRPIRLVDLATHSSGLGRELEPVEGVEKYTDASFAENLSTGELHFAPGSGALYSNVGFDVLGMALSDIGGAPYPDVLQQAVLEPIGLSATGYDRPAGENVMAGYDWDGNPMDAGDPIPNRAGASGLYTTANDMIRYLEWNLDRFGEEGAEARALSQSAHLFRDGLSPVLALDESGHMDAMGLGWVIMVQQGDTPLIIQKAGGTNGVFSYLAFAPHRGVGVFMAINQFNFSDSLAMADVVNELVATLAPR
ncbi:D-alanyl-D-alanine-carboxypeptidase/endopeptidase AmpH [Pseudoroseicyclus sp. H15]